MSSIPSGGIGGGAGVSRATAASSATPVSRQEASPSGVSAKPSAVALPTPVPTPLPNEQASSGQNTLSEQYFSSTDVSESYSLYTSTTGMDQQLGTLVSALISYLLGLDEDKEKKNELAGLAALMIVSAMASANSESVYSESYTSQVSQVSSSQSSGAVQATSYTQQSSAQSTSATSGGGLNITG